MPQTVEGVKLEWRTKAEADLETGEKQIPSHAKVKRKVKSLGALAAKDQEKFLPDSGVTPLVLASFAEYALEGETLPRDKDQVKALLPVPVPAFLLTSGEHRVHATRSVAAGRMGEANPLTIALGFKQPLEKRITAVFEQLESQRLVLLQKDAAGHDLPGAVANRATLKLAGLTPGYVTAKLDPVIAKLKPHVPTATSNQAAFPRTLWAWTMVVASRQIFEAAELSLDNPKRVLKYKAAQPRSQMGRFSAKKKVAPAGDAATTATKGKPAKKPVTTPAQDTKAAENPAEVPTAPPAATPAEVNAPATAADTKTTATG